MNRGKFNFTNIDRIDSRADLLTEKVNERSIELDMMTTNELVNLFSEEDKIQYLVDLTGIFPLDRVVTDEVLRKLSSKYVPPISEFDPDLQLTWFIPRDIIPKKTKNGKTYWIVEVIDSTSSLTKIKCWGVRPEKDMIHINRPYLAKLDFDPQWGFSTRSIRHNFRLLG